MLSLLVQQTALPTCIVTLVISSTLRPFPACNVLQILILFSCWLSKLLLIPLSCKFYSLSFSAGMPPARWLQHFLQPQMHAAWKAPIISGRLKLASLLAKSSSMLCFNYLLSGENITLADKKQSYNVSQFNDYGCSTL